jgi:hypothetical protein
LRSAILALKGSWEKWRIKKEKNCNKLKSIEGSYGSDLSLQLPHQSWRGHIKRYKYARTYTCKMCRYE